jgi:hypothetical protein
MGKIKIKKCLIKVVSELTEKIQYQRMLKVGGNLEEM